MRTKEVQTLLGNPGATHFNRIADNKIEVWDYIKHSGNITRKARLWFLNDRLKLWQSAEWGIFEPPQLNRPPDFESPHAPEFILEIKKNEA